VASDAARIVRQRVCSVAVVIVRVVGVTPHGVFVVLGSNSEVDDVEDDAQTSGDDQQYTNDGGLTTTVRVDHGCGLVRLTDVDWMYRNSAGHHGLLLRLHRDVFTSAQT